MNNIDIIGALSADLLRVALGYHNGAVKMAERSKQEALKRIVEINVESVHPYTGKLLQRIKQSLKQKDTEKVAEDALMYSALFQNYVLKKLS